MIDEKKLIEALKLSNSHHASNSREKSLLDRVIRIVKEQPKIEWIPVEERLPKLLERVLVYAKYTGEKSKNTFICNDVITTNWRDNCGKWVNMGTGYEVIAWMPLPKQYKGVMKDVE